MKLLLTSCGVVNESIKNELKRMIGKENLEGIKMLYCTTASNYEGGDMSGWLLDNLNILKELGFQIDICDLNGITREMCIKRLENAEVFFFEGGNPEWLYNCLINKSLKEKLLELLKDRIWIGASAGSIVLCPTIVNSVQNLFDETIENFAIEGLNFVPFQFVPHLNNEYFPKIKIENIKREKENLLEIDGKDVYVVDDNGAISVVDGKINIISEGKSYKI